MLIFAAEGVVHAISLEAGSTEMIESWQRLAPCSEFPASYAWFCLSITYSRSEYRAFSKKWRLLLLWVHFLPVVLAASFRPELFCILPWSEADPTLWLNFALLREMLNLLLLLGTVLILINLERTLRRPQEQQI
jgi:hypothetical protein